MSDKKKLLLLAGAGVHSKVVEAAHDMGVYVIVADYLSGSPAKHIADESLMYNIYDVDELVKYCTDHDVDGVLGFCVDPTQKPAQEIAEKAGLPTFGTREQVIALTDKTAFKDFCRHHNVDVIPEYTKAEALAGNLQLPVLVKPAESRGSRGATVCRSVDELPGAIATAEGESANGRALIERYMGDNQDLTISYLVKDGEPTLVSLGDRYSGREEDNLSRQLICTIQPSRYVNMYREKVDGRIKDMIKALGIENGPVFFQGFVDGDTVRLYDPGLRFPGNEYERIVEAATGINLMKDVVSYVVGDGIGEYGGPVKGCYDLDGKCAIQYMINVGPGKITRFDGLNQIRELPCVVDVQQRHFVGEQIEPTGDIKHRAGEVSILVDRDPAKMADAIRQVQELLVVEDAEGQNQLISPFEPSRCAEIYGS